MKQITINFTASKIVSDYELGKIGEHNATELTITPPTILSNDQRTAMYRVAFGIGRDEVLTEAYTSTPIVLTLWQQLTMHARLTLQLIAYDIDGEFIGKSERLTGFYFTPSVEIASVVDEDDAPDITAEISANTAARHTHSNKIVLDEIPAYEAGDTDKALVVGSDGLEWGTVASNGAIEIWSTGTTAAYSAQELSYYVDEGKHFTYKGYPVISYGYLIVPREFYFTYIRCRTTVNMDIPQYFSKCKVVGTTITESNAKQFVLKINNESPDSNGKVTLSIPAAQIQSDWEQSDNTALDYIKNKPATMPPSAHTHTMADVTDLAFPVTDVQVNGTSVVSSGVANITLPNYSTTEQDTGRKWINGETIYQKTYQGTTNPSYSAGSVTIDSFAGKNFLHGYGWCGQYSASSRIGVPAYLGNDYYSGLYYDEAGDNLVLFYSRGLANSSYEITIFYTKTL